VIRAILRWSVRAAVVAGTVAVTVRALQSLTGSASSGDGLVPSIGGDTWPPVPANPKRQG
jgi:hypothetical protein